MNTRWGRNVAAIIAASSIALGGSVAAVAAPVATPPASSVGVVLPSAVSVGKVNIQRIASPVAPVRGAVTVRPKVAYSGNVSFASRTFTVKQGSKTIARNATSARLKAGSYTVVTTAKYKVYTIVDGKRVYGEQLKSVTESQKLTVRTAVVIRNIAGRTVAYGKSVKIVPIVSVNSGVKVASSRLTVKSGSKTIASSKAAVNLRAGKYKVTTTVKYRVPTSTYTYTTSKSQYLTIKSGKKPSSVPGTGSWNCPSGYPIKGNASSGIYHVPGGSFYDRTNPEECFATRGAAEAAGYRASKV
jgi:hypothetical protein